MPARFCTDCGTLYQISDTAPGQRCPDCHTKAVARKNQRPRGNTRARGYDNNHQNIRAQALAQWQPGQPCAIGGEPTWDKTRLDLAHNQDRTGYLGLACWSHNRGHA